MNPYDPPQVPENPAAHLWQKRVAFESILSAEDGRILSTVWLTPVGEGNEFRLSSKTNIDNLLHRVPAVTLILDTAGEPKTQVISARELVRESGQWIVTLGSLVPAS